MYAAVFSKLGQICRREDTHYDVLDSPPVSFVININQKNEHLFSRPLLS